MKKIIVMALCAVFAVCQAYAQENIEDVDQEVMAAVDSSATEDQTPAQTPDYRAMVRQAYQPYQSNDLAQTNALLNQLMQQMGTAEDSFDPINGKIIRPIRGKSKFAQRHFIYQQLGISTVAGKDADIDPSSDGSNLNEEQAGKIDSAPDLVSKLNFGLNVDYTLTFIPGNVTEDGLELNKMGFGYNFGCLAAFDRQDNYGVTCDFMGKIGVEAGAEHMLGVGLEVLFGGGKSAGIMYDLDEKEPEPDYYTEWCFKYGAEFWVKTNLLQTKIPNTDILIFARFIKSVNPLDDDRLLSQYKMFNIFNEEAWGFGITIRHIF